MNRFRLTGWCSAGPNMRPVKAGESWKAGEIEVLREYERVDGFLSAIWSYWVFDAKGNRTELTKEEASWAVHQGAAFDRGGGVGRLLAVAGL